MLDSIIPEVPNHTHEHESPINNDVSKTNYRYYIQYINMLLHWVSETYRYEYDMALDDTLEPPCNMNSLLQNDAVIHYSKVGDEPTI